MNFREKYIELKTKHDMIGSRLSNNEEKLSIVQNDIDISIKCREIVNKLANDTLVGTLSWIENTVTMCIEQVYPGHTFKFKQEIKRNQLELSPVVVFERQELPPDYSYGGGMMDLISIALRVAIWATQKEKSIPTFFLDEPMKFMGSFASIGAEVIDQLSEKMGLQFIIITHPENLAIESFSNPKVFKFEKG